MKINKLTAENYRNFEGIEFSPCDEMNVICGENAQGKTNLIEAIWLFTGAKSFRGTKDAELVRLDTEKAYLTMDFLSGGVEKQAKIEIDARRHASLNGNNLQSAAGLVGNFCAIVFSPADLGIVSEGPSARRRFTDIAISQLYPKYLDDLRKYNRAVAQRNALLKEIKSSGFKNELIDTFEQSIAENGKRLVRARVRYLEQLKPFLCDIYAGLSSGKETITAEYLCDYEPENLREALEQRRAEDLQTCTTSVGPHRDDIDFCINGLSVRSFGSQGQKRSVAISLKLSEAEMLKKITGEQPVALLDDVMSELDPGRQNYILNHIKGWQVFITCCDPSNTANLESGKIFTMEKGKLKCISI